MSWQRGQYNSIIDVAGLRVGHAHDEARATGVSVVLPDDRSIAACDIRGGGPGTRETDALAPENFVDAVDGIFLSGGSVYGLAAGSAITDWLGAQGKGFRLVENVPPSPIVSGAILFDLSNGGDKDWGEQPPYYQLGREAAAAASHATFPLGNVGAGYGALAGHVKGGLGSASCITEDGFEIGALVAVNSFGAVVRPGTRRLWAADYEADDEMGGVEDDRKPDMGDIFANTKLAAAPRSVSTRTNTSLAVVAVNATLTPSEVRRVAMMAQDGLARAIRPAHAAVDGDSVFALATGRRELGGGGGGGGGGMRALEVSRLGAWGADCVSRAVGRAIWSAESLHGWVSYREFYGL